MVKISEVIIVEGKYDKNTLSQIVDATIVETGGFGVFNDKERLALMRKLADKRGIIIFTDGDGAGFIIRNFLKGAIAKDKIKHAFVPDIYGKEKRKNSPSKEGKLGLEGMKPEIILDALKKSGATIEGDESYQRNELTTADYFALGLSGGNNSDALRSAVKNKMGLPEKMSSKALFQALSILTTKDELMSIVSALKEHSSD